MTHPVFVDNLAGNTMEKALRARLSHLLEQQRVPTDLSIATGYFNPEGFELIQAYLKKAGGVRLLLGAEPLPAARYPERRLGQPRGERFDRQLAQDMVEESEKRLKRDRDRMSFTPETYQAVANLIEFLESGQIEVRRYERRFLHGKAFIFHGKNGVLAGSSNFTRAGLTSNLELNLGQYQPRVLDDVEEWFERLWDEAVEYDLAEIYRDRFKEYHPYLIYLRALWEIYGSELEEEGEETGKIQLTSFQTDGVFRARRILEEYNGVIIADAVGLGKSYMAAEIFSEVIEKRRQRALLIAPAQLRDGMWAQFKARYQSGIEVVSYEQMADDAQLGEGQGSHLSSDIDDYALIVIDEAHAFRNPDSRRSRALRRLLRGDPPKKVVMLTATPVNNSLWDLYDLLLLFVGHDAVFADRGIPSLKERFQVAESEDPFSLRPDLLFDILDQTTVRRTRHFVKRYYPNDTFRLPDGEEVVIKFPDPVVESRTYKLDAVLPGFFDEFASVLDPESAEKSLTLARYQPHRYIGGEELQREAALAGLIRSGLLKRFESSACAFTRTLERMITTHRDFVRAVRNGVVPTVDALNEMRDLDSDEAWEETLHGTDSLPAEGDVDGLIRDIETDIQILEQLRNRTSVVNQAGDPKLDILIEELVRIAENARREANSKQDERNRRKVIIFSYFADTVEWIAGHLQEKLATDPRLASFRGRMVVVHGNDARGGVSRADAVFGFAPDSSDAPPARSEDQFDILVTTDVLAEGMNLQQAGRIINYDLPWNPMRLVQRHGRVDRIGSPHEKVHLTCIFPDRELDGLLQLEERIRRKLAQAAASIGLDQAVIPGTEKTKQVFADTREDIERIRREDATLFEMGGEEAHAHSGEEYRQELRSGVERFGTSITELPWGVGSGFVRGERSGFVFCASVFGRPYFRFIPLHESEEIGRDTLSCLAIMSCGPDTQRVLRSDMEEAAFRAWQRAREDIYEEWREATDPASLQPRIRPLFRAAADHVRSHPAPGMTREEQDRLTDSLEAPWGRRIERTLRSVFTQETAHGGETTKEIAAVVERLALQPWKAPEPLPPIDPDEIDLIVWIGVEAEADIS